MPKDIGLFFIPFSSSLFSALHQPFKRKSVNIASLFDLDTYWSCNIFDNLLIYRCTTTLWHILLSVFQNYNTISCLGSTPSSWVQYFSKILPTILSFTQYILGRLQKCFSDVFSITCFYWKINIISNPLNPMVPVWKNVFNAL